MLKAAICVFYLGIIRNQRVSPALKATLIVSPDWESIFPSKRFEFLSGGGKDFVDARLARMHGEDIAIGVDDFIAGGPDVDARFFENGLEHFAAHPEISGKYRSVAS